MTEGGEGGRRGEEGGAAYSRERAIEAQIKIDKESE